VSPRVEDSYCVGQEGSIDDGHITGNWTRCDDDAHVQVAL